MAAFVSFVTRSLDLLDTMRDPKKLSAKMSEYSNPTDPTLLQLQSLLNQAEASKDSAAAQTNFNNLQQYIFKRELGDGASARALPCRALPLSAVGFGLLLCESIESRSRCFTWRSPFVSPTPPHPTHHAVLDLDMLGFGGVEPPFLPAFRAKAQKLAPGFYSIIKDPIMKKYIENPFSVRRPPAQHLPSPAPPLSLCSPRASSELGVVSSHPFHRDDHPIHAQQAVREAKEVAKAFTGF